MMAGGDEDVLIIDDRDRYARFRLISWWDQRKIARSKVMVVGAGALGNEVLKNLALLGIGHVVLVDYDEVEHSNLTRSMLYRSHDAGRPKAETAAGRVRELNPDVEITWINGDVMKDVGLGWFQDVDLVLGCLDNREARLWVNRQCWKVSIPWVDAAIQELMGVVKIFVPPDSACYECAMTEQDYRLINLKYSCPLLRREDLIEGKTPTTPTISAITAGMQTQEALKLLHGMAVQAGCAIVYNGIANNLYITQLPRKEECLSHHCYRGIQDASFGSRDKAQDLLASVGGGDLLLDRELVISLRCDLCGRSDDVLRPRTDVTMRDGMCPKCQVVMSVEMGHVVSAGSPLAGRRLEELGVPSNDILRIRKGGSTRHVRLTADRPTLKARGEAD
jgi:molybdopterin/thiamine biosynthesis adenylyltransferase